MRIAGEVNRAKLRNATQISLFIHAPVRGSEKASQLFILVPSIDATLVSKSQQRVSKNLYADYGVYWDLTGGQHL